MDDLEDLRINVLDKGYVKYIGHMGSDEAVIEAARMSTGKGFLGWVWEEDTYSDAYCGNCETHHLLDTLPEGCAGPVCTNCWADGCVILASDDNEFERKLLGRQGFPRDAGLLEYLFSNRHMTPFEMGELCIEVKAPIMVFREWHRHRTQSYNEFSARYSVMPSEHYVPEVSRLQEQSKTNKQGSGDLIDQNKAYKLCRSMRDEQQGIYENYEEFLEQGLSKEIARINTPVSRYSKMRAKTDLRNWLAFLSLRMETSAQWEIREYANAVAQIIQAIWPRTFELFLEHDFLGEKFSKTEMRALRRMVQLADDQSSRYYWSEGMSDKQVKKLLEKLTKDKEKAYETTLSKIRNF